MDDQPIIDGDELEANAPDFAPEIEDDEEDDAEPIADTDETEEEY